MSKTKNYLEVNRETEKLLYRVCTELKNNNGKSIIEDSDSNGSRWYELATTISKRGGHLIDKKLLLPPLRNRNRKYFYLGVINTYPDVKIIEVPIGNNKSRFHLFKNQEKYESFLSLHKIYNSY